MNHPDFEAGDSELDIGFTPKTETSIPPEMTRAIAMGMEDPSAIAARYGFIGAKWEKLQKWPPFLLTVANLRSEFEKSGVTFRLKAAMKADELADQVFVQAMSHETTLSQKMATLQYFAKMGDLEPKVDKASTPGEGFSISINLSGQSMTLTGTQNTAKPAAQTLEMVEEVPAPAQTIIAPEYAPLVDPELLREMRENALEG